MTSKFENIMLDLETMGNSPDAAIIAIGAVEFDLETATLGRRFYEVVDLESAVAGGGIIDALTVYWWLGQSDEARKAIYSEERSLINRVLTLFAAWLQEASPGVRVWGNGATFDNVILSQAYRRSGLARPWAYYNDRCYRTAVAPYRKQVPRPKPVVAHRAVDDAVAQAQHLIDIERWKRERFVPRCEINRWQGLPGGAAI